MNYNHKQFITKNKTICLLMLPHKVYKEFSFRLMVSRKILLPHKPIIVVVAIWLGTIKFVNYIYPFSFGHFSCLFFTIY